MTLQSTGPITIADVYREARKDVGLIGTTTYSANLSWIINNTKPAYRDSVQNLAGVLGYAYFQKNNAGNCSNGNCTIGAANCGNIQCTNCQIISTVNCVNCDVQEWLQPNCNCACTYNCVQSQVSYNCACACACACACGDACGG
jgi:hypothetical protein